MFTDLVHRGGNASGDGKSSEILIRRLSGDRVEDQSHGTRVVASMSATIRGGAIYGDRLWLNSLVLCVYFVSETLAGVTYIHARTRSVKNEERNEDAKRWPFLDLLANEIIGKRYPRNRGSNGNRPLHLAMEIGNSMNSLKLQLVFNLIETCKFNLLFLIY